MFNKPKRKIDKVFIHCSASDNPKHDDVSVMRQWHKARGWSDVGYHFFIKKDGTIQQGRSLEKIPAAQLNSKKIPGFSGNNYTIAICCHGLDENKFTQKQYDSLNSLCDLINISYDRKVTFHGHREIEYKECPVFDYKSVLKLDSKGYKR